MRTIVTLIWLANWLPKLFRGTPFSAVMLALTLVLGTACSSRPNKPTSRYVAPSVAPVRAAVAAAASAAGKAKAAIAKASDLVGRDSVEPADVPELRLALTDARDHIDTLTAHLLAAEVHIADLQLQISNVTAAANQERADKIVAQARAEKSEARERRTRGQRNKLFLAVLALTIWTFRKQLAGGAMFVLRKFLFIPF